MACQVTLDEDPVFRVEGLEDLGFTITGTPNVCRINGFLGLFLGVRGYNFTYFWGPGRLLI